MVELTEEFDRGKAGFKGCIEAATSPDNIPTYAGLGMGMIGGNILAKEIEKIYTEKKIDDGEVPSAAVQFVLRTLGRMVATVGLCGASGSLDGAAKTATENAAIASSGMIFVDLIKSYAPGDTLKDWADLQGVPTRRYEPRVIRARAQPRPAVLQTSRPVALQAGRPAMETAALVARPGETGPTMETASLSGAKLY